MQTPYLAALESSSLNRAGSRQIEVDVCEKENSCSHCGSIVFEQEEFAPTTGQQPTEYINCEQETQGNQVKVTQMNNLAKFLQPCTLYLYGKCKYNKILQF